MPGYDAELPFILKRENTARYENGRVIILDRRIYPFEVSFVECDTPAGVARAIKSMVTQGAGPSFAAGLAIVQAARTVKALSLERASEILERAVKELSSARPTNNAPARTAVRLKKIALQALETGEDPEEACLGHVQMLYDRYYERCRALGTHAAKVIPTGSLITHCFAEAALAEVLKSVSPDCLFVPETRPYLQGARLTATMARDLGIEVTLIPDAASGAIMRFHKPAAFVTGADCVTLDGHVVNKTGTYTTALAARDNQVPYYVLCFGPDQSRKTASDVEIEYRDPDEVLYFRSVPVTVSEMDAEYPAFDITSPELVTAYITHMGVFEHPAALAAWGNGNKHKE